MNVNGVSIAECGEGMTGGRKRLATICCGAGDASLIVRAMGRAGYWHVSWGPVASLGREVYAVWVVCGSGERMRMAVAAAYRAHGLVSFKESYVKGLCDRAGADAGGTVGGGECPRGTLAHTLPRADGSKRVYPDLRHGEARPLQTEFAAKV